MFHRTLLLTTLLAAAGGPLAAQQQPQPIKLPDFRPPTPLLGALLQNDTAAIGRLLDSGASPNEARFFGIPALTLAVVHSNRAAVEAMLAHGADVNAADKNGATALMIAAGGNTPDPAIVDALLGRGADPNARSKFGETALTWAMRRGDMHVIARLAPAAGASQASAVRQSVERAVALLQKSGAEFSRVSGCVSCHHQSLPQMAYGAAARRGFRVDGPAAEGQLKAVTGMYGAIREQLSEGKINLPSPGVSVGYALLGLHAQGYAPDVMTKAMVAAIARTQAPDGSLPTFPARPPMEASTFTSTAIGLRAMQIYGQGDQQHAEQVAKAAEWLKTARPDSQEERSMRLMGLAWAKPSERGLISEAAAELLRRQNQDGGWSQVEGLESDAYSTGQAMTALFQAGAIDPASPAWQHGVAYLLRTQMDDGSWLVRSRSMPVQDLRDSGFPHGRHQWISAAGTSWAAMALSLAEPARSMPTEDRSGGGEAAAQN